MNTQQGVLRYKQWLIVHERPVDFQADKVEIQNKPITTWCCAGQGNSELSVQFQKNVFFANEVAQALVGVDNSKCQLDIESIHFDLVQRLKLRDGSGWGSATHPWQFDVLDTKDASRVASGAPKNVAKTM